MDNYKVDTHRSDKWWHSVLLLIAFLLLLTITSCGPDRGQFRMEGSFKNFSQGELYVYTPDGTLRKLDTIKVMNGQFTYQVPLDTTVTFVVVFPNYSELPVIGESGKEVEIKGDASHLREIKVMGTKENELMTAFRLRTNELMPPELVKVAAQHIIDNPRSQTSAYILNRYFIQTLTPDYQKASELTALLLKEQPGNQQLVALSQKLNGLKNYKEKARLGRFTGTDISGKAVSNASLTGKVNVVSTWATWNYDSQNIQRKLRRLKKENGNRLGIVSICLDASTWDCRRSIERDSISWPNICDGRMWETPALTQLGLYFVPDNIITDQHGRIVACSLSSNEIDKKIEELLE